MRTRPLAFESPNDWKKFQTYLRDESRFILTPKWRQFIKTLTATSYKRQFVLEKGEGVARARIGALPEFPHRENGKIEIKPLPDKEMVGPPRHKAVEGRLNPAGIPYLYLANNKETAIAEVRPWVGAYVTVAYFKLVKNLRLIDLTKDFAKSKRQLRPVESERVCENKIWREINQSFSEPVSPDDKVSQYVHTQYVTETFKCYGYDGVRYKSSLHENGHNFLLFDPHSVSFVKNIVVKVDGVRYRFQTLDKAK